MLPRMEFELGKTTHEQRVVLVAHPRPGGAGYQYDLVKHPQGQRDDTVRIFSLTDEVLDALCAAHQKAKGMQL